MHGCDDDEVIATHRCARCSATLDEASVEGHGERCFVVGDAVATRYGKPEVIGRIASVIGPGCFAVEISTSTGGCVAGSKLAYGADALRHIPRHGQATDDDLVDRVVRDNIPPETKRIIKERRPLYDGLTAEQCLSLMVREQHEDATCRICCLTKREHQLHRGRDCEQYTAAITPVQLEAGRAEWSRRLRARIAAAREQERNRVQLDVDPEGIPWR